MTLKHLHSKTNKDENSPRIFPYWNIFIGFTLFAIALICLMLNMYSHSFSFVTITNQINHAVSLSSTKTLPHIIFILADDMGYTDIGNGDMPLSIVTTQLTSLAKSGLTLTSYYAQEVCTPSRAALLTGRYPLSLGMQYGVVQTELPWGLNLNETILPEVLSANGYATHMLGKWHLGHHTARYLPTARGFDTALGYMDGDNFYFSKICPNQNAFHDFMYADKDCYYSYMGDDLEKYSTYFYRDKAIEIIQSHDLSTPLFLYIAMQAVHSPFDDIKESFDEIPEDYISQDVYSQILNLLPGQKSQQYAVSMKILDDAVYSIVQALEDRDMMSNAYVVFASDNGGCVTDGGKNSDLRGTKATLFEGGTKVDAFIYSPLLPSDVVGTVYSNLFHVTDWFPTLLDLAGIEYSASDDKSIDGYSHADAIESADGGDSPREYLLYNSYYASLDVNGNMFDNIDINAAFAIRNSRYKLMHTYNNSAYGGWYGLYHVNEDDDNLQSVVDCRQQDALTGEFEYMLFDLEADPYEKNNLYDSSDEDILEAKDDLYTQIYSLNSKIAVTDDEEMIGEDESASQVWEDKSNYIMPFRDPEEDVIIRNQLIAALTYPSYCGNYTN